METSTNHRWVQGELRSLAAFLERLALPHTAGAVRDIRLRVGAARLTSRRSEIVEHIATIYREELPTATNILGLADQEYRLMLLERLDDLVIGLTQSGMHRAPYLALARSQLRSARLTQNIRDIYESIAQPTSGRARYLRPHFAAGRPQR